MNRRALEVSMDPDLLGSAAMQRGWVHGHEAFRSRMVEMLAEATDVKPRTIHDGRQHRDVHGEAAERVIRRGLDLLDVGLGDLALLPKRHPVKLALATFVKRHHSVRNAWISEQLHMGHVSLVGQCHQMVKTSKDARRALRRLEKCVGIGSHQGGETQRISG